MLQKNLYKNILKNMDFRRLKEKSYKEAAVFLLLFEKESDPYILTILKSADKHYPWSNQIALPGGHVDKSDKTNLDAAYREIKEELGIEKKDVKSIGSIGYYKTIHQVDIEVLVGLWRRKTKLKYDMKEIAEVIEIPLEHIRKIHKANKFNGRIPDILELIYPYKNLKIWGVTARIIHSFMEAIPSDFFEK